MSGPRVALISTHYWRSRQRAGFHFLAAGLQANGCILEFITSNVSAVKKWRGNRLFAQPGFAPNCGRRLSGEDGVAATVLYAPYSVENLRWPLLNALAAPLYRRYPQRFAALLAEAAGAADVIIMESAPGLVLFPLLRELNPRARFVYRVSDDLLLLRPHPQVFAAERELLRAAVLVSVPCAFLERVLREREPRARVRLQPHGVDKDAFARATASPYPAGRHAVLAGTGYVDWQFLAVAARLRPEITFHIIGPLPQKVQAPNIRYYGEMAYTDTVPYIKFADIGLQARHGNAAVASLTDSLKVWQYRQCRLPIVAPDTIPPAGDGWFSYGDDDASVVAALERAVTWPRPAAPAPGILDWREVAAGLLREALA